MKTKYILGTLLLAFTMTGFMACSDVENPEVDTGLRTGTASKIEVYKDSLPITIFPIVLFMVYSWVLVQLVDVIILNGKIRTTEVMLLVVD